MGSDRALSIGGAARQPAFPVGSGLAELSSLHGISHGPLSSLMEPPVAPGAARLRPAHYPNNTKESL